MSNYFKNFFNKFTNYKHDNHTNFHLDFNNSDCAVKLLGRAPRNINMDLTHKLIKQKSILITGAGGTIGSELTRQVLNFEPYELILLDQSEFNLYKIKQELLVLGLDKKCKFHLINVCEKHHIEKIFSNYKIDVLFHAAAYKHVPIVQNNKCSAALTNINGTCLIFDMAVKYNTKQVVLVSTDKAVNPTSFMGATKRISELYAQALDIAQNETRFVTVRFGNVLGSTGSVAPLFKEQIQKGGPITITHPDVSRYFMTTSEAVALILVAASLDSTQKSIITHDGRVFVLDMGEPIKIIDLAKNMLKAFNLSPKDIEIIYIGLQSGEKMFEEIFLDTERFKQTGIDGVLLASPPLIDLPLLKPRLNDVLKYSKLGEEKKLEEAVNYLVPEFYPSSITAFTKGFVSLPQHSKPN